ncbi:zinc finger protein Noc [Dermacentor silvarum]|uniref:zinc finger protein Noc n=1 Tax=Dermacentor silvarum TaxID=543639 RepID=UPI0018995EC8|nr:zinc finger protein Noc [Dermacentor silvarum]
MLTSSNQYLRPEFLSPLPTTLDAKKSPLALLAQTCSNIGADNPNIKPIIPPLEKPKDQDKSKGKSSSLSSSSTSSSSQLDDKPSFKPYESAKKEDSASNGDVGGGKKSPSSSSKSPPRVASSSPAASIASSGKASPTASEGGHSKSDASSCSATAITTTTSSSSSTPSSQNTLSGLGYGGAAALGLDLARDKDALSQLTSLSAAYKGLNPLANCCSPLLAGHLPGSVDGSFPGAALASQALKLGGYPVGSPLSPYVGYARVKTAGGGTSLVPVCRDPFCTNCQMSMQSAQLGVCPSGCTQCSHDRLGQSLGLNPGLVPPGMGSGGLGSPLYPGAAAAHSMLTRPNVCSWMVGDTYCGKRFSTSEELLQHLRTHTNLSVTDSSALPLLSPSLSVPSVSLSAAAAACHLHYSTAPSLTTPAGLRRTYPTSLSPVGSLSARYHPYKPPIPTFPGTPFAPLPHPSLGMYYSPYGLYGQRLGPPVHP